MAETKPYLIIYHERGSTKRNWITINAYSSRQAKTYVMRIYPHIVVDKVRLR